MRRAVSFFLAVGDKPRSIRGGTQAWDAGSPAWQADLVVGGTFSPKAKNLSARLDVSISGIPMPMLYGRYGSPVDNGDGSTSL
ncbi:MAG: hypothetical protein WKF67_07385, partial [Rubrobacteraceae bacterium]